MEELCAICSIRLMMREGETEEEALERLQSILDSELHNLADHTVECDVLKIEYA